MLSSRSCEDTPKYSKSKSKIPVPLPPVGHTLASSSAFQGRPFNAPPPRTPIAADKNKAINKFFKAQKEAALGAQKQQATPSTAERRALVEHSPQQVSRHRGVSDREKPRKSMNEILSNLAPVKAVLVEFRERFPKRCDVQLKALFEHTQALLSHASDLESQKFGSKLFNLTCSWVDGSYAKLPDVFLQWTLRVLDTYTAEDMQLFVTFLCHQLLQRQQLLHPNTSTVELFIQLMIRNHRDSIDLSLLTTELMESFPNFAANMNVGNSLLWLLIHSEADCDLKLWLTHFVPVLSSISATQSFQLQCLKYGRLCVERFTKFHNGQPSIMVSAQAVLDLFDLVYSGQYDLETSMIQNLLDDILALVHEDKIRLDDTTSLFPYVLSQLGKVQGPARDHLMLLGVHCLRMQSNSFDAWREPVTMYADEIAVLLEWLDGRDEDDARVRDFADYTLKCMASDSQNARTSHAAESIFRHSRRRISCSSISGIVWILLLSLFMIALLVNPDGSSVDAACEKVVKTVYELWQELESKSHVLMDRAHELFENRQQYVDQYIDLEAMSVKLKDLTNRLFNGTNILEILFKKGP